jgi:UDP-N-acetylmuramate dehydrogenase
VSAELEEIARRLGPDVRRNESLAPCTTYRVGGPAALLLKVHDEHHLREVAAVVAGTDLPVLVVGRGSNLLVADRGFDGLVLVLGDGLASVAIDGTTMRVGAAASLPVVARRSAREGLTGFEWAVGVPGSVGGAVRMNAGGHGSDLAAVLASVHLVDLRTGEESQPAAAALGLDYRRSLVAPHHVVVSAELHLAEGDRTVAEASIAAIVRWRREHQPGGANAGSVFTNPPGDSAGRLIDAAGLKGFRVGSASVSTKHANFIQADDGGSADDIRRLMDEIRRRVHDRCGVELVPETRMVGFGDPQARDPQPRPQHDVEVESSIDGGMRG